MWWRTREGYWIKVKDMDLSHLKNAVRFMKKYPQWRQNERRFLMAELSRRSRTPRKELDSDVYY